MSKINISFDATELNEFKSCPCKYNYRHNQDKVPLTKQKPLDNGEVLHYGLEAYYKTLQRNEPYEKAVDNLLVAIRVALQDSDLSSSEGNRCLEVAEENVEFWRIADQGIQILEVEKAFAYILYEDSNFKIIMKGKIDLLYSDNRYEAVPMDHKSFTRSFPLKRLASQFINYAIATDSNFLFVNRIGFQTSLKDHERFRRIPLSFDPIFKEQWKQDTIKWCMYYYDCVDLNSWPMNDTSCEKFNRTCEYYDICDTTGDENKIYKLQTDFKSAPKWDVTKDLKK